LKQEEIDRIKALNGFPKSKSIKNQNLRQQFRACSVGGMNVMDQQELNQLRQNFVNVKLPGIKEAEAASPADELSNNLFNVDDRGNIINFVLNPPSPTWSKQEYVEIVFGISQNKLL
jgi:hypothetical protein